jgi:hypothetical protein
VPRFDLAKADALSVVQRLPGNTRVRFIVADSVPYVIGDFNASDGAILDAISSARVTDAADDLLAAIELARAADIPPQRIYVFSDADPTQLRNQAAADVEWAMVGQPADNAAITGLSARRLPATHRTQVLVSIANYGAAAVTATLTLARDRSEIARQELTLVPDSDSALSLTLDDADGVLIASLEHADALSADNVRHLVVPEPSTVNVLITRRDSSFLQKALSVNQEISIVESESAAHDVVFCDGCSDLPDSSADVLLVPPRSAAPQNPVALAKVATDHPIGDGLNFDGTSGITLAHHRRPDASTVIAQGGGVPVLVAYEAGARRVVELRLDPDRGPFPLSSAFPVLIANAVGWLANVESNRTALTAGDPLQWQIRGQQRPPVVNGPDGRVVESTFNDGILSVTGTSAAGIYRVALESGSRMVAINPAVRGESDLALSSRPANAGASARSAAAAVSRDITSVVVLAALALLALEWRYRLAGRLA